MIQKAFESDSLDNSQSLMLRVLEEVATRRRQGDDFPDERIIAENPNLMPELGEMLSAMRLTETACHLAAESATLHPDSSDSTRRSRGQAGTSGSQLGRLERDMFRGYELGEIIGRGATGVVYRAVQTSTGREVAIKVLLQGTFESNSEESRFEREAHILAQLKHPNIVTVYDTGWSSGRYFLVMDYVRGRQLDQWLRTKKPTLDEKLQMFAAIAETVHAAHLRGIIHRDLKPSNIRIDENGCPHLLDFGLAKVLDASGADQPNDVPPAYAHSMTMTGQFVGSLPWASPEQAEGAPHKIDIRTDVYSLGVIFYHALAGHFPYPVMGNIRDVIDRILTSPPPRLRSTCPELDEDLDTIVLTCLNKERERRYQSAGALAQDLRHRLAREPIAAKRDSSWYVLRKTLRRHRLAFGVITGIGVLSIIYAATVSVFYSQAKRDAQRARLTQSFLQDTLFQASSHRMGSGATLSQVLDAASRRLPDEFSMQPEVEAALQYTVGSAYESIWQKEQGIEHLRRAVELNRSAHGTDHPDTLRSMVLLGMVMAETKRPESVPLLREALAASHRVYGNQHPLVAENLAELAFSLWAAAQPPQWSEADRLYAQSVAMFHQTVGNEHPDLARTLMGLASMNRARNKTTEAERQFRLACDMSNHLLGDVHQFTLECRMGLADILVDLGRLDEAQEILDDLQPRAERQFGTRMMPTVLRRTAFVQMARLQYENAERTMFDIQASVCEHLAKEHPEKFRELSDLAAALRTKAGRRGADSVYLASLEATQAIAPNPMESARTLVALGTIRFRQELYAYSEVLLSRCLEYLDRAQSPEYSVRARATRMLATSLQMQGRQAEAEAVLQKTLVILKDALGWQEPSTQWIAGELRQMYVRAGRMEEATRIPLPALR